MFDFMFGSPFVPAFRFDGMFDPPAERTRRTLTLGDEAFVKMLVKDVNKTVRTLDIVEGEENIELYNDDRVKDAFERAVERGVKIRFVLKPVINDGATICK